MSTTEQTLVPRPLPLATLDDTGERMIPEKSGRQTFWEHIYRYRFAVPFVRNRRILDIACGEAYGAHALLKAGAASVVGIDISEDSVAYARQKYGIDARLGDAECIPLPDGSIDVVVSFETIEHLAHPQTFLQESLRVLADGGLLIVSTPNRNLYGHAVQNRFHHSEMSEDQFVSLLTANYGKVELYAQCSVSAGWWSPRAWAASQSFWDRVPGMWRLRSLCCPHVFRVSGARYRHATDEAILGQERFHSSWLNPFTVRRRSRWSGEQPMYFLAVARKGRGHE